MSDQIAVFPGEDAAPEAVEPTVSLLRRMDLDLEFVFPPVEAHSEDLAADRIPEELTMAIEAADAVLFGAARGDGETYIKILTYLRTAHAGGMPANIRPSKYFQGANSPLVDPSDIDFITVRENTPSPFNPDEGVEGELMELAALTADGDYPGVLGKDFDAVAPGTYAVQVMSERNVKQVARTACEIALERFSHRPISVVSATKATSLPMTHGQFDAIVEAVAGEYDAIEWKHLQVDNVAKLLVVHPQQFDVIIAPNAEGDILSDIGAGVVGGLGLAPAGCYGEETAYFEPVHGTAPDIVGENIINPTAMFLTAAMMLDYLDRGPAAGRIEDAIAAVYAAGEPLTPDQGGSASTTEMVDAIARHLGLE